MASHITLEETGAPYETQPILFSKGEQQSEAYLKVNPRGKVPALQLDEGQVLTENTAILSYLAKKFPGANLWPGDPTSEARALSIMGGSPPRCIRRLRILPVRNASLPMRLA